MSRPVTPYHAGRNAAYHRRERTPPFPAPESGDDSALSPHRAWLQGYDDRAREREEKQAESKKAAARGVGGP